MSRRALALRGSATPATAGVSAPTDRRFRRPETPPSRRRATRTIVRAAIATLAIGVGLGLTAWIATLAADSSYLRVQHIVVDGATRLSSSDVETLVAGVRGSSIVKVDLEVHRQRLLNSPWVKDVSFARRLPSTVHVRLVERQPMAIARLGQHLYLIDVEGVVTDQYGPKYSDLDFPVVDGLMRSPAAGGAAVDADRFGLVARLLEAVSTREGLRARLSQIDVTNAHDAVVVLEGDPARLHLGESRFVERLATYLEMLPALSREYAAIDYADLRFDDRVFVRPVRDSKK